MCSHWIIKKKLQNGKREDDFLMLEILQVDSITEL